MTINFGVIWDAVIVTGKTFFHIRISETLCKTTLSLHSLKQDCKWEEKSNGQRAVIVEMAYCNTAEYSISATDPQPILGRAVDILQEKQPKFLPASPPRAGSRTPLSLCNTSLWSYPAHVQGSDAKTPQVYSLLHPHLLSQWQSLNRGSRLKEMAPLS